jgi:type II secretory pathway pseudopilin PulG
LISLFLVQKGYSMASHQFLQKNRRQGGYTIIELGIALTIVAVLIISGLAGVTAVLDSTRANDQIASAGRTIAKLQNVVSTSATLQNMTTQRAIGLNFFPNNRVNGARDRVIGVFSGGSEEVTTNAAAIGTLGANIPPFRAGLYVIHNIPRAVCTDVALALAPLADSAWVIATPADQTAAIVAAPPVGNNIRTNGAAVAPVAVSTQCNVANQLLSSLVLLIRP